jgi:integrase
MATIKITNRNVESLVKQATKELASTKVKELIYWDTELAGLGLRVGPSGKASWLAKKHLGKGGRGSKLIVCAFGSTASHTPDEARNQAQKLFEDIRNGINPNDKTRAKRAEDIEAYQNGKLSDLLDSWSAKNPKKGEYGKEVARMIKTDILPGLGASTLVRDITRQECIKLIDSKPRGTARGIFAILRPFLKWCVEREVIAKSPIEGLTQPEPFEARDRVLDDEELLLVWFAASSLPYPWGPFYKLLMLTAQRRDEVAGMEWAELNLDKREWIIPGSRTKNGKEHLVHVSPMAFDILANLKQRAKKNSIASCYVFTTTDETHISGYSRAKEFLDAKILRLNDEAEIPSWRVHDIRRSVATGLGGLKVPPHIIERILNHVSGVNGGIVGVYQRFEYVEERKQALIAWANHINELVLARLKKEREANENVLAFRERRGELGL